ncbi:type VI secretion system baseplate subunit TssG [Caballeronia sp. SEWSISQ10-4 2]|uniref:type VI secretion system baseplate subunit TssG n=1 Tax=Caballeronia sp. SEWSISQ10-4 2 TaxID=2937438 RepID=UPI002651E194|nr:type VI secretion system baseplate subunit TssG [Caballeronia sp. SEWSISQ10-4 2]MDN7183250.1 type VI secretion system baseplate subunit TssG [Caballeronia sp. SEWSISQ10-4 2]
MALTRWRDTATVEELLFGEPERIDVFQLVRLLRVRDSASPAAALKLKQRLMWRLMSGEADTRSFAGFSQRLRFRADLSPAFPGCEVTACTSLDSAATPVTPATQQAASVKTGMVEIRTPNYCIASELGPLPEPFVDWVRDRLRDDDQTFAAFLDVFNHRVNILRHQLKARQDVALDYALPQDTLQADFLASIAGVGSRDAEAQIALPRRAWLGMTATLADPRRSAAAALTALRQYLGVPATQLVPLVGGWRPLSAQQWPSLGRQATLGGDAVLGAQVWNEMAGVRLHVPDVDYGRLCRLLPPPWTAPSIATDSSSRTQPDDAPLDGYLGLVHMVRLLFDRRVDCTIELTTRAAQLPQSMLTATPGLGDTAPSSAQPTGVPYMGLRLGQTAWLASSSEHDADALHEVMRQVSFMIVGDPSVDRSDASTESFQ